MVKKKIKSKNYHDYVIRDGKFIGAFEEMYQNIDDPWHLGDTTHIQYDIALYLLAKYKICYTGGQVFDIGCGKGAFTARLRKQMPKARILAGDIAPTAIKKAEKNYGCLNINFKVFDIQREFKKINKRFDLIVISELMWYILPKFQKIVNYLMKNVLKENGYLLISQTFYGPGEQKYGREIIKTPEEMISLINLKPIEMIETNRFSNHNVIILFRK